MRSTPRVLRRRKTPETGNPLTRLFENDVVMTSSELVMRLKAQGMTSANARQVLLRNSRSGSSIWRSERLRLARDERLFARSDSVRTPDFYKGAAAKLTAANRHGMARCLAALSERTLLHKVDVLKLLAVTDGRAGHQAGKRLYANEIAGLEEIGVRVLQRNTPLESIVGYGVSDADADELANQAAAGIRNETLLVRILIDRLRRQNICSWGTVELPDYERLYTIFNGQAFSAFGFSYLAPLVKWKKGASKPTACPVLLDAHHGLCTLPRVEALLQRIERATRRGRSFLPSLGVIAAKDFSEEAWGAARRAGLVTVSFRQSFGDEALEAMVVVERLLHDLRKENATSEAAQEFQKFSDLLSDLKTNPVVTSLRSIGFEVIAGLVLRSIGYESVELGRIVPWLTTTRDVDVFGFSGNELRVVECKAYHRRKSIKVEDVTKFFTETVPALQDWLRRSGYRQFKTCNAEVWTTGPLGREARNELNRLKAPIGSTWRIVSREDIRQILPCQIKDRCGDLLEAIAMEKSSSHEAS